MKINIVKSKNLSINHFDNLKKLLTPFSMPLEFIFKDGTFSEPNNFWDRLNLIQSIQNFRQVNAIDDDDFVIFLTTKRDQNNWFSACLNDRNKNIFVSTIEWTEDNVIDINQIEYPISYQIIENIFQYLITDSDADYNELAHNETLGCINDMCSLKENIIFKLRTADICTNCQIIADAKLNIDVYDQIIEILENIRFQFLHNRRNFSIFQKSINKAKVDSLREIKDFVIANLDNNETAIQEWIDEDNGRYRKQRSLIFGIDYFDPKREGEIHMRKRFDIMAEQNLENHVIIELKSPNAKLFKIDTNDNLNDGMTTTYSISSELSRAIPQILAYKRWYKLMSAEQLESIGLSELKSISECIIVIGRREDNEVWKSNFDDLKSHLGITILTYDDLIDKMNNTIANLENLLN